MRFSGTSPDGRLVEVVELPDHPFFVASQFHPEFLSRPTHAHPIFRKATKRQAQLKRPVYSVTVRWRFFLLHLFIEALLRCHRLRRPGIIRVMTGEGGTYGDRSFR